MLQLLKSLGEALNGLLEPSHPLRQELAASRSAIPLKATNNHTRAIHDAVAAAYDACSPPAIHTIASDTKLDASASAEIFVEKQRRLNQRKRAIDSVRGAVDVVGKELVVDSTIYGQPDSFSQDEIIELQDRLDIVLALYEVLYERHPDIDDFEPGNLLIPILEELTEILPSDVWRELWTWVEVRKKRFTQLSHWNPTRYHAEAQNMLDSRGKSLPLLRTINNLLRTLSRSSEDLILRGRIHMFASTVFKLSDRSSVNLRGQYAELQTTWEEEAAEVNGPDGDVDMNEREDDEKAEDPADTGNTDDDGLYAKFWSLQVYFANPPYVSGKLPGPKGLPNPSLQDFKLKTEAVLPRLFAETEKSKRNAAVERVGQKRKREDEEEVQAFFHPRLLTDKRLFEYQLADLSFRRQILAQYYIFFQFLLNFGDKSAPNQKNHMMPQDFRIDDLTNRWIKSRISEIMQDLAGEAADGQRFKDVLLGIIMKERQHAAWKNKNCPPDFYEPFAKLNDAGQPVDEAGKPVVFYLDNAAEQWEQQTRFKRKRMTPMGGVHLARFWREAEIARSKPRSKPLTWRDVAHQVAEIKAEEADDEAMGTLTPELKERNKRALQMLNWRAARQAAASELGHFSSWSLPHDITVLESNIEKRKEDALRKAAEPKMDEGAEADAVNEAKLDTEAGAAADGEGEDGLEAEAAAEADGEAEGEAEGETADEGTATPADEVLEAGAEVDAQGDDKKEEGAGGVEEEMDARAEVADQADPEREAAGPTDVPAVQSEIDVAAETEAISDEVPEKEQPTGGEQLTDKPNRPPTPELPPPDEDITMT